MLVGILDLDVHDLLDDAVQRPVPVMVAVAPRAVLDRRVHAMESFHAERGADLGQVLRRHDLAAEHRSGQPEVDACFADVERQLVQPGRRADDRVGVEAATEVDDELVRRDRSEPDRRGVAALEEIVEDRGRPVEVLVVEEVDGDRRRREDAGAPEVVGHRLALLAVLVDAERHDERLRQRAARAQQVDAGGLAAQVEVALDQRPQLGSADDREVGEAGAAVGVAGEER